MERAYLCSASAMFSRVPQQAAHGEMSLHPHFMPVPEHCESTRTWVCLCLLSHWGAPWSLGSTAVSLPYHRVVLLLCPHFPLFSQLALPHGSAPSWVTSQLVLTAFFPMLLEHGQPCRPRPALGEGAQWSSSTLPKRPAGVFWLMIDFTFVFLRNTF